MVRFNSLKIFINANEAKPGGNIGAMLSPYLFSSNMMDFCKRFNEQSKDYLNIINIPVFLYTNSIDKTYTFIIKNLSISLFIIFYLALNIKIEILFLFDLVLFYSKIYKISLFQSSLIIFSSLRSFKKKFSILKMFNSLKNKNNL